MKHWSARRYIREMLRMTKKGYGGISRIDELEDKLNQVGNGFRSHAEDVKILIKCICEFLFSSHMLKDAIARGSSEKDESALRALIPYDVLMLKHHLELTDL